MRPPTWRSRCSVDCPLRSERHHRGIRRPSSRTQAAPGPFGGAEVPRPEGRHARRAETDRHASGCFRRVLTTETTSGLPFSAAPLLKHTVRRLFAMALDGAQTVRRIRQRVFVAATFYHRCVVEFNGRVVDAAPLPKVTDELSTLAISRMGIRSLTILASRAEIASDRSSVVRAVSRALVCNWANFASALAWAID